MLSEYINETPPVDDCACELVDWIEFQALFNEFQTYKIPNLRTLNEELEDGVDDEIDVQDNLDEELVQRVYEEINLRTQSLGGAYPFTLDRENYELCAIETDEITLGGWIYLYCLILSHAKADSVLKKSLGLTGNDLRRKPMQVAATYAAAAEMGNAISFGFPRPNNTGIIDAIDHAFGQTIGEGVALSEPKDGYLVSSKDAGIDIIAWKNSVDNLPGKLLMYGQVASGYNWEDKSVKNDIDQFKCTFFSDPPQSPEISSIFIPFCIPPNSHGTLKNRLNGLAAKFGIVYYRYRLPRLAEDGWMIGQTAQEGFEKFIDHIEDSSCFRETVESFLANP